MCALSVIRVSEMRILAKFDFLVGARCDNDVAVAQRRQLYARSAHTAGARMQQHALARLHLAQPTQRQECGQVRLRPGRLLEMCVRLLCTRKRTTAKSATGAPSKI